MSTVTVIGTGNMGTAIGALVERGGHRLQVIGQQGTDEVVGDLVVLAVPYAALAEVVEQRGASLAGRIVVDITNPFDTATMDGLVVPGDSSAAAELAAKLPDSTVLKAFNTTFAATLSGKVGPLTTTVLIAGDDAAAKETLAELVRDAGLRAKDAGSLKRARELEALGFLQVTLALAGAIPWSGGFGLVE